MSGLFGGGDITNTELRIGSLPVQQSSQGVPITLLWGRNRVPPNLLWFDDFEAIENRNTQDGGGKGGAPTIINVTYTYRASVVMGLCAGVCGGVRSVWRDKDKIVASTRTLPSDQMSHVELVPVDKIVTVTGADRWAATVGVYTVGIDGALTPTVDYTEAAGVYTFGLTVAAGAEIEIDYSVATVVEDLSALQVAGFSWFGDGAIGQSGWDYLVGAHPAQALGYSGICNVGAYRFALSSAAGLPQVSFEVDGPAQMGGGNPDANPADVVTGIVTDPIYGAGLDTVLLDPLAAYRAWCNAAGLWVSPAWAERKGVFEYVTQLTKITHAQPLWSVNILKVVPMATEALTSDTGSYTPAPEYSAPVYALTDDDFRDPVKETRSEPADRFNRVSVKYRNRAADYADAVESAEDKASIDAFGLIEAPDVVQADEVATAPVAAVVGELVLREYMSDGGQYHFIIPINYDLLEPLDIVQIEDARIGLTPRAVRLIEIGESEDDGSSQVVAEDVRVTGAVIQSRQVGSGFAYVGGPPSAASMRAVMMPTGATDNVQQLWLGVSAGDNWSGASVWVSSTGSDYRRVAEINVRARMGTLAGDIALASAELNPAQVLGVNVVGSTTLASASQVDADAYRSLVWVAGELMSYRDATLTAAARYDLGYLHRALYGTTSPAHSTGDAWLRLDDALAKIDVPAADIGKTAFIKIVSRNALGTYVQGLDEVAAIQIELTAQPSSPDAVQGLALTSAFISNYFEVAWQTPGRTDDYEVELRDLADNLLRTAYTSAPVFRYLNADAVDDGDVKRDYTVKVRARNAGGNGPWATLAVSNPAPAIITGVMSSGSGVSRTISWTASIATDFAGYLARFSTSTGFDPAAGDGTGFYDGTAASALLDGLTVGVAYYVRVAAYDVWDKDIGDQIWSAEYSFTA